VVAFFVTAFLVADFLDDLVAFSDDLPVAFFDCAMARRKARTVV
jgi:hypothetical protein